MFDLPEEVYNLYDRRLVLLAYRGSVAHNMYIPNTDPNSVDDVDIMGVFMAPANYYVGLKNVKTAVEHSITKDGVLYDCVFYEFRHFVKLLLKNNPNVLSMLWLKSEHYLYSAHNFRLLLENRDIFSSKQVFHTFGGYANSQLKRMESYNKQGYMGEKRKRLVEKYGYDVKNAAHLIRLLTMGIEFLSEGKMYVFRESDANTLLDVKRGKWKLNDVKETAKLLFDDLELAYSKSKLPLKPNVEKADEIVSEIVYHYIYLEQLV